MDLYCTEYDVSGPFPLTVRWEKRRLACFAGVLAAGALMTKRECAGHYGHNCKLTIERDESQAFCSELYQLLDISTTLRRESRCRCGSREGKKRGCHSLLSGLARALIFSRQKQFLLILLVLSSSLPSRHD